VIKGTKEINKGATERNKKRNVNLKCGMYQRRNEWEQQPIAET
jgi:hypothetical protein